MRRWLGLFVSRMPLVRKLAFISAAATTVALVVAACCSCGTTHVTRAPAPARHRDAGGGRRIQFDRVALVR